MVTERPTPNWIAGFDAGQTHTTCRLAQANQQGSWRVVGEGQGPGVSHLAAPEGRQRFSAALQRSLAAALAQRQQPAGTLVAACIGASGIEAGSSVQHEGLLLAAEALGLPQAQVVVTGDERTALHGAAAAGRGHHGGGQAAATRTAGILLISGTGCIGLGRNLQGAEHRCGGWGWLLDGAGSALDIGRDGLALSLQMADGRLHDGPLRRALWEALEQTPDDPAAAQAIKALVVQPGFSPAGLARLAPVVDQLARSGDTGALAIMERSGAALAAMAATIATRLGLEAPVVWTSGGALLHLPTLRSALQHQLANQCPTATLEAPGGDACDGALLLAQERAAGQVFKPR